MRQDRLGRFYGHTSTLSLAQQDSQKNQSVRQSVLRRALSCQSTSRRKADVSCIPIRTSMKRKAVDPESPPVEKKRKVANPKDWQQLEGCILQVARTWMPPWDLLHPDIQDMQVGAGSATTRFITCFFCGDGQSRNGNCQDPRYHGRGVPYEVLYTIIFWASAHQHSRVLDPF